MWLICKVGHVLAVYLTCLCTLNSKLELILTNFCFPHKYVTCGKLTEMISETIPSMLLSPAGAILFWSMSPFQLSCWSVVLGDACDIAGSTRKLRFTNKKKKLMDRRLSKHGTCTTTRQTELNIWKPRHNMITGNKWVLVVIDAAILK